MSNPHVMEWIQDYLDGRLSLEEAARVEEHLAECSVCRREWIEMNNMKNLLSELPDEELPEGFKEELHSKLLDASVEKKRFSVYLRRFGAVAAVLAIGVFSVSQLNHRTSEPAGAMAANTAHSEVASAAPTVPEPKDAAPQTFDGTQNFSTSQTGGSGKSPVVYSGTSDAKKDITTGAAKKVGSKKHVALADSAKQAPTVQSSAVPEAQTLGVSNAEISNVPVESSAKLAAAPASAVRSMQPEIQADMASNSKKIVREGSVELDVDNPADVVSKFKQWISEMGGTVVVDSTDKNLMLKIPSDQFDFACQQLGTFGIPKGLIVTTKDITAAYSEVQNKLQALKVGTMTPSNAAADLHLELQQWDTQLQFSKLMIHLVQK